MKVLIFPNCAMANTYVQVEMLHAVKNIPDCVLGLATGSTPIELYHGLAKDYALNKTDWSHVTTFNLDEYVGVEPTDKSSYRYFMQHHLFNHINIPVKNTFLPDPSTIDIKALSAYDTLIADHKFIDLQLLGIGNNGHIGFNEPPCDWNLKTHIVNLTSSTIATNAQLFFKGNEALVPKKAITMGIASIMQAHEIIMMVFGKNKAEIVKQLIDIKEPDVNLPASILKIHPHFILVLDKAAASLLTNKS